jgi:DNA-directed RNA polymerase subunit M/transcription elongation factor TFIIS
MVMWKAKGCPKCGGDIYLDVDEDVWFDHCLQCGYMRINSDMVCPQCGYNMLLEKDGNDRFYHCSHCGYTGEFYNIDN